MYVGSGLRGFEFQASSLPASRFSGSGSHVEVVSRLRPFGIFTFQHSF